MKLASWKTNLTGFLTIVGTGCTALSTNPAFAKWSGVLTMIAAGIGLMLARDNNVSDQKAGARKEINPSLETP